MKIFFDGVEVKLPFPREVRIELAPTDQVAKRFESEPLKFVIANGFLSLASLTITNDMSNDIFPYLGIGTSNALTCLSITSSQIVDDAEPSVTVEKTELRHLIKPAPY